ncbi:MAG TPA: four-carbon acid sugar kinase family protein [Myxococcales bacterium]|nr:four-carbon acid sugar kinase family protein [Myxococcales bacterium]
MTDVTVIADDLTGAADCGIAFALAGLPTFVAIGNAPAPDSAQIVSVDTDTRRLEREEAARKSGEVTRDAYLRGSRHLYKKIDSTLRGHVAAELATTFRAAADLSGGEAPLVILAPAFPGTGRTTRDGRVLVSGVPLEESEVWRKSGMTGPADPVAMLREAGLAAEPVRLSMVRAGSNDLRVALSDLIGRGVQVAVCDAEQEDDLRRIAEAGAKLRWPVIWVGSGGLARHLPAALGLRPRAGTDSRPRLPDGPILALVGSRSTVARDQARLLGAEEGVATFELDVDLLLGGAGSAQWTRAAADLRRALAAGQDAVLVTQLGSDVDLAIGPALADALGRFATASADQIGGLIATGGDIARALLGSLGAGGLHLLGEVEPGVPIGLADARRPIPVVTKAGAFGTPETLQRSRAALKRLIRAGDS